MIDNNHIEFDINRIEKLVSYYIKLNFNPSESDKLEIGKPQGIFGAGIGKPQGIFGVFDKYSASAFDFTSILKSDETFSQILTRFIKESGYKNSVVYNRANIDRRHFSKIINHDDYQPSKQTVLAFAIALKLNFDKTKALLASAGFTLSNGILSDVIVSAFIENKIFDVDVVNRILYKYDQPLLGG